MQVIDIRVSPGRVEEYRKLLAKVRAEALQRGEPFIIRVSDGDLGVDVVVDVPVTH